MANIKNSSKLKTYSFSLLELLVVICIIATLAAMMLPSLSRAKEYAYEVSCKNNIRSIALGTRTYMMDFKNKLPAPASGYWLDDFSTTSYPYTNTLKVYLCPKSTTKIKSTANLNGGTDYYICGTVSDNDKNNGLGNSPYKIDISNPGNSPTMVAFRAAAATAKRCIYENMRGANTSPRRNHFGYFNYITIDNMRLERAKDLYGFFWLDNKRELVYVTQPQTYSYSY